MLNKDIENGIFRVSNPRLNLNVIGKERKDVGLKPDGKIIFEFQTGGDIFLKEVNSTETTESTIVKEIKAHSYSNNGLNYTIYLEDREIILESYLTSLSYSGDEDIKALVASLPKTYQEILKSYPYKKALIMIAIKFGKGGFSRETGNYSYSIDIFGTALQIFKLSDLIRADENTYSGELPADLGDWKISRWYQKYDKKSKIGELYVDFARKDFSGSDDYKTFWDNGYACFSTNEPLVIEFKPEDIDPENYEVNPVVGAGYCSPIFNDSRNKL